MAVLFTLSYDVISHLCSLCVMTSFHACVTHFFAASRDRTVKVWDLEAMTYVESLFGHEVWRSISPETHFWRDLTLLFLGACSWNCRHAAGARGDRVS